MTGLGVAEGTTADNGVRRGGVVPGAARVDVAGIVAFGPALPACIALGRPAGSGRSPLGQQLVPQSSFRWGVGEGCSARESSEVPPHVAHSNLGSHPLKGGW